MLTGPRWRLTLKSTLHRSLFNDISVLQRLAAAQSGAGKARVMSGTFWKPTYCYSASEVCMESEGNELYQWRMCPAPGTGEVPGKAKQNRSSSVHFHSKNRQGERPRGYS